MVTGKHLQSEWLFGGRRLLFDSRGRMPGECVVVAPVDNDLPVDRLVSASTEF